MSSATIVGMGQREQLVEEFESTRLYHDPHRYIIYRISNSIFLA